MEKSSKVRKLRCDVCGTEIMVSSSGDDKWHPIYCCGLEVHGKQGGKPAPKAAKKTAPSRKRSGAGAASKTKSKLKRKTTRTAASGKGTKRPAAKTKTTRKTASAARTKKK